MLQESVLINFLQKFLYCRWILARGVYECLEQKFNLVFAEPVHVFESGSRSSAGANQQSAASDPLDL